MRKGTNFKLAFIAVLSVSFTVASLITFLVAYYYGCLQFQLLGDFCGGILEKRPDCKQAILEVLKSDSTSPAASAGENILLSFGYQQSDFFGINGKVFWGASFGVFAGGSLFLFPSGSGIKTGQHG